MITLLMVLFIVMFAIGQTDLAKFKQLKEGLNNSLGDGKAPQVGDGDGVMDGVKQVNVTQPKPQLAIHTAEAEAALKEKVAHDAAVTQEQNLLKQAQQEIKQQLDSAGLGNAVSFKLESRGLVVTVVTDQVLFDLGSDVLRPEGKVVLDGMAPALAKLPNQIAIDGHTDDRPIRGGRFPSNWELSTARATSVLRYLIDLHHLPANRLSAAGYADQRPKQPNDTDAHRDANRRVEVVVLSNANANTGSG